MAAILYLKNGRLEQAPPTAGPTHLEQALELVAAVPKGSHSVHVEGVLPLTDGGGLVLLLGHPDTLVRLATVLCTGQRSNRGGGDFC